MASAQFNSLLNSMPTYRSPLNQSNWTLPSNLTANDPSIALLQNKAQDTSGWLNKMNTQQAGEEQIARESARQQSRSGFAEAANRMAMRGGLSSGARERLGTQGANALMNANTQIGMQGAAQRAQNAVGAENLQNQLLQQAGQMGSSQQQFNIGNILGQNATQNQADLAAWQTKMQALAAQEQANATYEASKPKKSGLLGLGIGGIL